MTPKTLPVCRCRTFWKFLALSRIFFKFRSFELSVSNPFYDGISRVVKRRNFQLDVQYSFRNSLGQFYFSKYYYCKFSHPSIVPILNWRFPFPVMPNNKFICKILRIFQQHAFFNRHFLNKGKQDTAKIKSGVLF